MRTLLLILITTLSLHAQVNVTGKSFRIMNSDSTHGEINNTEYVTSAGYYRYKENGVWYYRASTADVAAATALLTASNGLTKTGNVFRLGGTLTSNTIIADNGSGWNLEFGQNLTRLGNFRAYASGTVSIDGTTAANVQTGAQTLTLNTTTAALTGATLNLTSSSGNTNITAAGTFNVTSTAPATIAGSLVTIQSNSGDLSVTANSNAIIRATAGDVDLITGGLERLVIDADGSWGINGVDGTAGQALVSNGASSTPTWQTIGTIGGTIASTQVGYGSGANTLTSEAAFTYTASTNTLSVDNIAAATGGNLALSTGASITASATTDIFLNANTGDITLNATDDIIISQLPATNNALTTLLGRNSSTGIIEERTVASITGTPAGSDTQVQFNNAGAFGADADLTFTGGNLLTATNATVTTALINSALTATRIPVIGASGLFTDDAQLVYDATNNILTLATDITLNGTADQISISGGGGNTIYSVEGILRTTGTQDVGINTTGVNIRLNPRIGGGSSFLIIENLPTSCAGAPTGAVANISGVLNICP